MFLKQLKLTNFRNYSQLTLSFDQSTDGSTILVGNNGAGKSNLLEGIYFLSTSKSVRVDREEELIKSDQSFLRVDGLALEEVGQEIKLEIVIQILDERFSKEVKVNGLPKRVVDFMGNLPAVIFYPSDINMVTGSPSLRRWHLDLALAQVDSGYKKALTSYEQFLTSRNRVLKRIREGKGRVDELEYWTKGLVEYGQAISDKRQAFFEFINRLETPLGKFRFEYQKSQITAERLEETNGREVAFAATLIGPHRDDFHVILEGAKRTIGSKDAEDSISPSGFQNDKRGRDLAHFGSRGEQRTATLAFKLAQLEYMAKILGKRPILLLDDIFSELDVSHRAHVVEVVSKQQTIIATVELENIPKDFLNSSRILRVEDGTIKRPNQ